MSQSGWYHDKAAECDRRALACTNAATREIAASIDAAEQAVKRQKGE
jgi:hypothetical protein